MIDEKAEDLGTGLVLPPWLESVRKDLEKVLPRVHLPKKEVLNKQQQADNKEN
jgi:hypothetical protein